MWRCVHGSGVNVSMHRLRSQPAMSSYLSELIDKSIFPRNRKIWIFPGSNITSRGTVPGIAIMCKLKLPLLFFLLLSISGVVLLQAPLVWRNPETNVHITPTHRSTNKHKRVNFILQFELGMNDDDGIVLLLLIELLRIWSYLYIATRLYRTSILFCCVIHQ